MIRTQKVSCNLCGSRDSTFLFNARDRLHGIGDIFTYVQCKECGLVYMNPQVVPEDIEKLYPADYHPHSITKKGIGFRIRSLQNRIITIPVIGHLVKGMMNVKIVAPIYRRLNQQSRILDVGCGTGSFLNTVRAETGCKVYGVDIYDKTPWGLLGSLQYLLYGDNINPKYRNRLRHSFLLWILLLPWTISVSLLKKSDIMVVYAKK